MGLCSNKQMIRGKVFDKSPFRLIDPWCGFGWSLIYIYIYMYFLYYVCFPDPIKQTVLAEMHIMQRNIVNNCSGFGGGGS